MKRVLLLIFLNTLYSCTVNIEISDISKTPGLYSGYKELNNEEKQLIIKL